MAAVASNLTHKHAPGPRGQILFGSVRHVRRDPLSFYLAARHEFGDVVRFRSLGPYYWYLLSHPDDIEHVLRRHVQNYPKGIFNAHLGLLVGEGLLTSEGDFWLRQRRLAQPAFHRQRLAALGATMAQAAEATAERWRPSARSGASFDVAAEMMSLTLQIVGQALFSADVSGEADAVGRALTVALEHVNHRMYYMFALPERIPTPRNRRFRKAMRTLDQVALGIIE